MTQELPEDLRTEAAITTITTITATTAYLMSLVHNGKWHTESEPFHVSNFFREGDDFRLPNKKHNRRRRHRKLFYFMLLLCYFIRL